MMTSMITDSMTPSITIGMTLSTRGVTNILYSSNDLNNYRKRSYYRSNCRNNMNSNILNKIGQGNAVAPTASLTNKRYSRHWERIYDTIDNIIIYPIDGII